MDPHVSVSHGVPVYQLLGNKEVHVWWCVKGCCSWSH